MIIRACDIQNSDQLREVIARHHIEFFDFGCSRGGNIGCVESKIRLRGLGFDIDEKKLEEADEAGYLVSDLDILDIPDFPFVDYGYFSDMLEHLNDITQVRLFLQKACNVCRKQVLIRQPYIDSDLFLMQMGVKSSYSHWTGHKMNLTTPVMFNLLNDLRKKREGMEFMIYYTKPVLNSEFERIFSIHADIDSKYYDASVDIPKPKVVFPFPHFYQINGVLFLDGQDDRMYKKISRPSVIMYDSRRGYMNQDIFLNAFQLSWPGRMKGKVIPKMWNLARRIKQLIK